MGLQLHGPDQELPLGDKAGHRRRPDHGKRGIAKALTIEVERRLNEAGILIVTCLIEGDNQASRKFFQSLGYVGHPDITYYSKRQSLDW